VQKGVQVATREERLKILQLIEDGKVSAEEGAQLMAALADASGEDVAAQESGKRRWLRVIVTDTFTGRPKVNVRIPASIVDMALRVGAQFIPSREWVDLDEVSAALRSGVSGKIVDVIDEEDGERIEVIID